MKNNRNQMDTLRWQYSVSLRDMVIANAQNNLQRPQFFLATLVAFTYFSWCAAVFFHHNVLISMLVGFLASVAMMLLVFSLSVFVLYKRYMRMSEGKPREYTLTPQCLTIKGPEGDLKMNLDKYTFRRVTQKCLIFYPKTVRSAARLVFFNTPDDMTKALVPISTTRMEETKWL